MIGCHREVETVASKELNTISVVLPKIDEEELQSAIAGRAAVIQRPPEQQ